MSLAESGLIGGGQRFELLPIVGALIAAGFAALSPGFIALGNVSGGSPLGRSFLLLGVGWAGLSVARRVGLGVTPTGTRWPLAVSAFAAVAITIFVVLVDCVLFRSVLPPGLVDAMRTPLGERLAYFIPRAFNENIVYRLFAMSMLVWLIGSFWRGNNGRPADGAYWAAIVLAQIANVAINAIFTAPEAPTLIALLYDSIRYVAPGLVWGYLYWRYGLATSEAAHVGTHLLLQPAFSVLFL